MTKRAEIIVGIVKGVTDQSPTPQLFDNFADFGQRMFETPRVGGAKKGAAFIRGNTRGRANADLRESKLLVIDGDHRKTERSPSCCHPDELRKALDEEGLRYIMHASRSNNPEKEIWRHRTIIECTEMMEQKDLETNIVQLYERLWEHDVDIGFPKEVKNWAQLWYLPNVEQESDWFYHSNYTGRKWQTKFDHDDPGKSTRTKTGLSKLEDKQKPEVRKDWGTDWSKPIGDVTTGQKGPTWEDYIKNIVTGAEYHTSLMSLSFALAKSQFTADANRMICESLILQSPPGERRDERIGELDKLITGAYKRISKDLDPGIDIPDIDENRGGRGPMPLPGGVFQHVVEDLYSMQNYQNRQVAIVTALGLFAGIAGRKFNVENMGLNLYLLMSMRTGGGKSSIGEQIHKLLREAEMLAGMQVSFLGPKRATGPKAIGDMLHQAPCRVSVMSEMGKMLKSKAGDQEGFTRAVLDIYEASGYGKIIGAEAYSDDNNSVKPLFSPSLTIVGESTPGALIEALGQDDNIQNGFLPRFLLFKYDGDKPLKNRNVRTEATEITKKRVAGLVNTCVSGMEDKYKVHNLQWDKDLRDEWFDYADYWVGQTNYWRKRNDNPLKESMSNRVAAMAAKLAGLCAVVNNDDLTIRRDDWEWAKAFTEWCVAGVDEFMMSKAGDVASDDMMQNSRVAMRHFVTWINKSKQDEIVDDQNYPHVELARLAVLPGFLILRRLEMMITFKKRDKINRSTALNTLEYMFERGYLIEIPQEDLPIQKKNSKRGRKARNDKYYQITDIGLALIKADV